LGVVPDNTKRIADIREILRAGATSVTSDGTTVSFDFNQLRRELRELMAEDDRLRGRRPFAASINLGGF
jgi:hypothetical protein